MSPAERLLTAVHRRLRVRAVSASFWDWFVVAAMLSLALLVAARGLGVPALGPSASLLLVAAVPGAAALLALATGVRVSPAAAAAAADACAGTNDLFLASTCLGRAAGAFGPVVAARADERAAALHAAQVVPWRPWPRLARGAGVLLVLTATALGLPRLPHGPGTAVAAGVAEAQQQQRRETAQRLAALRDEQVTAPHSPAVAAAVAELQHVLQQTQRAAVAANAAQLQERQREFGDAWRAANRAAANAADGAAAQEFGARLDARMQEWLRELAGGSADGLARELDRLREQVRDLPAGAPDRAAKLQQLQRGLEDLADAAAASAPGGAAEQALARALEQLQHLAGGEPTADDLEALQQALELAQLELGALAQRTRDREQLERALRAMQLARQLNELGELDGEACAGCNSLADYEDLFAQRLQERLAAARAAACAQCNGTGQQDGAACAACAGSGLAAQAGQGAGAFGGAGEGRGGKAPEDPNAPPSSFEPEQSRAALTAGRLLMQAGAQGTADGGVPQRGHDDALQQVRQGATEAILQERVPPGYHDGIRKYFDELGRRNR
jgi:hypothetical protein